MSDDLPRLAAFIERMQELGIDVRVSMSIDVPFEQLLLASEQAGDGVHVALSPQLGQALNEHELTTRQFTEFLRYLKLPASTPLKLEEVHQAAAKQRCTIAELVRRAGLWGARERRMRAAGAPAQRRPASKA